VVLLASCRLFREGLEHILQSSSFGAIAESATIEEALQQIHRGEQIDLLLCSLDAGEDMAELLGAIVTLRTAHPAARTVLLTPSCSGPELVAAVLAGVNGIVLREISGVMLTRALELVMHGQQVLPPGLAAEVVGVLQAEEAGDQPGQHAAPSLCIADAAGRSVRHSTEKTGKALLVSQLAMTASAFLDDRLSPDRTRVLSLSERETQILECLVDGCSNKLIARRLDIAEATVKVHIKGLLRKINASNRTQAAIWALNNCAALRPNRAVRVDGIGLEELALAATTAGAVGTERSPFTSQAA
jgi:two-component system nitrate/nitrite response regulator NarL